MTASSLTGAATNTQRITGEQALALLTSAPLGELMDRADEIRRRMHGRRTHFVHSLNINPTNVCSNRCRLCAFWREGGSGEAYTVSLAQGRALMKRARAWGLSDLHIVGGLSDRLRLDYYESLIASARRLLPSVLVQALTAVEIDHLARLEGLEVREVLRRLHAAGLGSMPGGGAEIFAASIRRRICPEKISARRWLAIHAEAHAQGIPTNATMLYGHHETPEDIVDHLSRLRDLQDRTGGLLAFAPLPFHARGTQLRVPWGPGGEKTVRVTAVARIFLDNVPHLRVLANFMHRKLLQVLLRSGADDVGGTSIDERIARSAGASDEHRFAGRGDIEAFLRHLRLEPVFTNSVYGGLRPRALAATKPPSRRPDGPLRRSLERAEAGQRLTARQAVALHEQADLGALGAAALRRRLAVVPGRLATFVLDRNITFTNVCIASCRFCAFHKRPGQDGQFVMPIEEIVRRAEQAAAVGATQIMLQGGLNPELDLAYYQRMLRAIKQRVRLCLHSLSPAEVWHLSAQAGLTVEQTLGRLQQAGLDSLPGGGAEILVDAVRRTVSPRKITTGQWLAVMRAAHGLGMKTTATMVYGLGETAAQRVEHMLRVRELQDETGGFRAFIPWSFQSGNTSLRRRVQSGPDYLRMVALSRLVLDNVPHVQAGWVTEGPDLAQLALSFGADDFGGVLMEESVVRAAGCSHSVTGERIIALMREAGWTPAQRSTDYRILRRFDASPAAIGKRA